MTTTAVEYPKPFGLQRMIGAWQADQDAESGITTKPYMTMAAIVRRMDRSDARQLPALFGLAGRDALAWSAYNSIFIPNLRGEVVS